MVSSLTIWLQNSRCHPGRSEYHSDLLNEGRDNFRPNRFVFVPIALSTTIPRAPMPLFEVPDWNVPSSVQSSVQSGKPSKKRKRSVNEEDVRLGEVAFNFEKLVKQLEEGGSTSPKGKKKARSEGLKSEKKTENTSNADRRPEGKKERKTKQKLKEKPPKPTENSTVLPLKKKRKKENKFEQTPVVTEDTPKPPKLSKKSKSSKEANLTPLQSKMKATLEGARFRCVLPEAWMMNY